MKKSSISLAAVSSGWCSKNRDATLVAGICPATYSWAVRSIAVLNSLRMVGAVFRQTLTRAVNVPRSISSI